MAWRLWETPFVLLLLLLGVLILAILWGWLPHWPTPTGIYHPSAP
jgi:hypothetical protein